MALTQSTIGQRVASHPELVRVVLIVGTLLVLMLLMTAAFGLHPIGPIDIVADPGTGLGMPF